MAKILVVEDDRAIGGLLETELRRHDHRVVWERSGRAALREAAVGEFDLVLLDLGLPDLDGVEVCRQLRGLQEDCVVVMVTARDQEMDVVVGLEAGADDYLTKPFSFAELIARVRAHVRRGVGPRRARPVLRVGEMVVDTAARQVIVGGEPVALRPREFDLLARLAVDAGTAVSRGDLIDDVWDENWHQSTKTLDVHVAALRSKMSAVAARRPGVAVPRIVTLRGHGYRLDPDGSELT